jgi:Domain of unknown function (DUF4394)
VSSLSANVLPLRGTFFGVDFNPLADRLRIIGDTGQNLAHDVNNVAGTVANTALNYPAPVNINPATGVTGAAYTNNDLDANTGTTLFDIDTSLNQVAIQSLPAAGSLVATGKLTVDPDSWAGFDIYSRLVGGVTVSNSAFWLLRLGFQHDLDAAVLFVAEGFVKLGTILERPAVGNDE